jgi:hypothetical protein
VELIALIADHQWMGEAIKPSPILEAKGVTAEHQVEAAKAL